MNYLIRLKKTIFLLFAAILLSLPTSPTLADPVALNTWDEVVAAVKQANLNGIGTVRLITRKTFLVTEPLPEIVGNIVIEGNGAKFEAVSDYHDGLVTISENGYLELRDVWITKFDLNATPFPTLINNFGQLSLSGVTMDRNGHITRRAGPILDNYGDVSFQNVTVYSNGVNIPETSGSSFTIRNCGLMEILNSTIANNNSFTGKIAMVPITEGAGLSPYVSPSCGPGIFRIGNTILSSYRKLSIDDCRFGSVVDLGGNVDAGDSCGFQPARNIIGVHPEFQRFGRHGGLVPLLSLKSTSPAIDSGINKNCSAVDGRLAKRPVEGTPGGGAVCDSGAFEFVEERNLPELSANGMNGLWFDAEADGHYIHVMRVQPDKVYINWSTFDENAHQMWILAVATSIDSTNFSAQAYINTGGQLVPGGAPVGHIVEEWGTVRLRFDDCRNGNFSYSANNPDFGQGGFSIERLAFIDDIGCTND